MTTIAEHLLAGDDAYRWRKTLQRKFADRLPRALRKQALNGIWAGKLKHMRHFDHDYAFVREAAGLSSMSFRGEEIMHSLPIGEIIGRITRPVTLVTTGPSALEYDWEALRNSGRMIIGVTGGATFLRERGITPELLILSDPDFSKTGGFHIRDAVGVPLVIEYRSAVSLHRYFPEALNNRPVSLVERVNKWYGVPKLSHQELCRLNEQSGSPFFISDSKDKLERIGWSDRLDWGIYPSSTVAFVALQILIGLGAQDIEIVGMDLGGNQSIYANARPSRLEEQYQDVILPSFEMMRIALEGRGLKINNLSPVCPLPAEIFESSSVHRHDRK